MVGNPTLKGRYLGRTVTGPIDPGDLDLWPAPAGVHTVRIDSSELQALCPVTNQPDVYRLTIEYEPADVIVESKALKLYLLGFRDVGISAEALTARIRHDLASVLACPVRVSTTQQVRGGLTITSEAAG
jgi:7-cyano-7-deazaguanine reductase